MNVSTWAGFVVTALLLGCADSRDVRYKRAMREIDRAHERLKDNLVEEKIGNVAAVQKAIRGEASHIAEVASRPEVISHIDEEEFRRNAAFLREDATKLEEAVAAGKLGEALEILPRLTSDCAQCHNQYRKDAD
jgi:cytochrome c556